MDHARRQVPGPGAARPSSSAAISASSPGSTSSRLAAAAVEQRAPAGEGRALARVGAKSAAGQVQARQRLAQGGAVLDRTRRGQRPSRKLTIAAGLPASRRSALPSRACTGSGQGRPRRAGAPSGPGRRAGRPGRRASRRCVRMKRPRSVLEAEVGVLHPLGDALERERGAELVVGEEGAQRRLRDVGVDRHRVRRPWRRLSGIGGERKVMLSSATATSSTRHARAERGRRRPPPRPGAPGAEAPAERPSVRDAVEPGPVDVGGGRRSARRGRRRAGAPPRPAGASWRSWRRPRPGTGRRAARSPPPRAGGWWWRSRCPRCAGPSMPREAALQHLDDARRCRRPRAWSGSRRRARAGSGTATASASATVSTRITEPAATWPMVPDHLGVAGVADQQDGAAGPVVALDLAVDLGDQGAGGVGEQQPAPARLGRHALGHAVGGEHDQPVLGHLVQLLDEHGAQAAQLVDDVAVVDDLVADIDRRAVLAQRLLDDLDGALDAGAEAARAGEQDRERRAGGIGQGAGLGRRHGRRVPSTTPHGWRGHGR